MASHANGLQHYKWSRVKLQQQHTILTAKLAYTFLKIETHDARMRQLLSADDPPDLNEMRSAMNAHMREIRELKNMSNAQFKQTHMDDSDPLLEEEREEEVEYSPDINFFYTCTDSVEMFER